MIIQPRTRKLIFSYLPDWLLTIALAAIFFSLDKVEGYRRQFSLEESSIRHTYAVHERVPNIALYFICFVAPVLLQPIVNFITIRSWWDLHNSTLGLILGLALTGSITQFVKITVGRPRPDLIDRCQPPPGSTDPEFGLSTWLICTRTDLLRDGFRSFPSGHSSLSFAGLGFFAYYLAGKLHLFDKRGHAGKAWISLAPFAAAALVAISRTMDYRHHWQDVLVGSILGTIMSYFAYRQYYPPLSSEMSHKPYSPRIKRERDAIIPIHHNDRSSSPSPGPSNGNENSNTYHGFGQGNHTAYNPPAITRRYTDEPISGDDYELAGTVRRPDPGPLEEVWKDGSLERQELDRVRSTPTGGDS
ncbi:hypothetical protein Moror_6469 [Moniliophthora roreri MCA 2997]|uniref:Phosphatidic acid phosphatase type 2/haloperoxidase domain-containing protein n=2 Tax=Moniliophthora roreri TaxID=221103 RepID=V2XVJ2_MONRO|nr:hypothetical protein Moror_6469 [Moniliophthora roreri MCA 2997]